MKNKYSRVISILLVMIMVMTSLSFVFAEENGEANEAAEPSVEEIAPEDAETPAEEAVDEQETEAATDISSENDSTNLLRTDLLSEEAETTVTLTINYLYAARVRSTVGKKEAAPSVTRTLKVGETYSITSPAISGYTATRETVEGEITDESETEININVYYNPDVKVTVNYVYADSVKGKAGQTAANSKSVTVKFGKRYSIQSPKVTGYAPTDEVVNGRVTLKTDTETEITIPYYAVPTDPVANLVLHPAYNSIILTWNRMADAKSYIVQRSTDNKNFTDIATLDNNSSARFVYTDKTANGTTGTFSVARTYYYRVLTVSYSDLKSAPAAVSGTCVRPMYETVTLKESVSLTSHDGKNKTIKFSSGQTIVAQGFGGGKYEFWYNGYFFTINYVRVKNCKADYQANSVANGKATSYSGIWGRQNYASTDGVGDNYSGIRFYDKISAENFVNDSRHGKSSRTKYLIWVSTYTQHVYIFTGSKGNWTLYKDWECSTGAPQSPSPTGFDKQVEQKISSRIGISYWSTFQTLNAIHGQRNSYTFGSPQSNGCVRNYNTNGKWVYDNCAVGSGVIIY